MIECYYSWCENHYKDEPFCKREKCSKTQAELDRYALRRIVYNPIDEILEPK